MSNIRTPMQNSAVRRFSQVYVEIPPSPLHRSVSRILTSDNMPAQHVSTLSANRKENAPLRIFQTQFPGTSESLSRKRKLSESDTNAAAPVPSSSGMKKQKLAADKLKATKSTKGGPLIPMTQLPNTSEEFPNGFFYCHQCYKKRDPATGIHCTLKDAHNHRCKVKFCTPCLKNRYGERVEELTAPTKPQEDPAHVPNETYLWKCPKCRDICNCARCRKAKGLEPTGNLTLAARRVGADSAAMILSDNPATIGILPGKGQQISPAERKPKGRKPAEASTSSSSKPRGKAKDPVAADASTKPKPKPKPKTLPTLKWSKIPMDGALPLAETVSRIQIREFVLRFACIMDSRSISRKMLEELEEVGGKGRGWGGDDDDEEEDVVGWVSEPCVKGVVIGLLAMLHSDEKGPRERKLIGDAMKELRAGGANLTKVWAILASLRESIGQSHDISHAAKSLSNLPDPLPAPSSVTYHNTRTTRTTNANTFLVAQSSQMVPVLVVLTEAALKTEVVRTEIEEGVKEGKDKTRESREQIKIENERWEKEEKEKDAKSTAAKQKRHAHKRTILDVEESLKVAMNAYTPRFGGPLGKDMDGRLYWALSPGIAERENAIQMIAQGDSEESTGKKHKRAVPDDAERKEMKKWSWFVGIWGKSPDGETERIKAIKKQKMVESDEESESDDADQDWWGVWEPGEIKKAADWIEIRGNLGDDGTSEAQTEKATTIADGQGIGGSSKESSHLSEISDTDTTDVNLYHRNSSKAELRSLVKGLREFANLLEWRLSKDLDESVSKSVATSQFYK